MDKERFLASLRDPKKSREELLTMRENALRKNAPEHVALAEGVLDERFPFWRRPVTRRGGSSPTSAMFLGEVRSFPSQKEAYVWLVERVIQHHPQPFETINWETLYVAKGPRTLYFAKSLKRLFQTSPDHTADPNKYHRLRNGWFAKLVLSDHQKFDLLTKLAAIAKLQFGSEWDWNGLGAGSPGRSAESLLEELEQLP